MFRLCNFRALAAVVTVAIAFLGGFGQTNPATAHAESAYPVRTCYEPNQATPKGSSIPDPNTWCQNVFSELIVTSLNSGVGVSWKAPKSTLLWGCGPSGEITNCAITGVRVIATHYSATKFSQGSCTATIDSGGCNIGGLKPGLTHKLDIFVDLANGEWLRTNYSVVPCCGVPAPATDVQASLVGNALDVTWAASKNWGGATSMSYNVTTDPSSTSCAAENLACRLENLEYNKPYKVVVTARNSAGESPPAVSVSTYTITTGPPDPPMISRVKFGAGKGATVSWIAPVITGGLAVTKYTVIAKPGGATCSATGGTACTIAGLNAGRAYSFIATATNSKGVSKASAPSVAGRLNGPEVLVQAPTASASGTTATVSWKAPAAKTGGALVSYVVKATGGAGTCTTKSTRCSISGLRAGGSYQFNVTTVRTGGASGAVSTASLTMPAPPVPVAPKPTAEFS